MIGEFYEKKLIVLGAGQIGMKVAGDILPCMLNEFSDIYFLIII